MQRLPRKRDRPAPAVGGIADERMTERREMHADLVGASRLEPAAQQRGEAEALQHFDMGARRLPRGDDRHRRATRRMPADRRVDGAAARDVARGQREIFAGHGSRLQRPHERGVRGQGLGDDQEAARVLVEPVDDAGARHLLQLRRMMEERVQQRARPVAGARMHDEPRRLVDDEQSLVLGDDGKRDRFGQRCRFPAAAIRRERRPFRRRAPCASASRGGRPASRVRRRSRPGGARARIAAARAKARRRSAARPRRPAASAHECPRRRAPPRRRRDVGGGGPGRHAGGATRGVGYNRRLVRSDRSACSVCHILSRRPAAAPSPRWALLRRLVACVAFLAIAGCGLLPDVVDETTNLNAEQTLQARARRDGRGKLYAGDQALRDARGALSLWPLCAAGDPRARVFQLSGRRDRRGRRRLRPLHPHVPQQSERRLRLLPEGARQLPGGPGPARLRVRARPRGARAQGHARELCRVQGARREVSGQPVRAGLDRPDALPHECAREVRSDRRPLLLQPRRVRRGDQPGPGGDRRLSEDDVERGARSTCSPRATTSSDSSSCATIRSPCCGRLSRTASISPGPSRSRGGSSGRPRYRRSLRGLAGFVPQAPASLPRPRCAPLESPKGRARGRLGYEARGRGPWATLAATLRKNASTSSSSRVRRIGGRLCQIRLPYGLSVSRGSQIISTPRSVSVRISRPAPCFSAITACGS